MLFSIFLQMKIKAVRELKLYFIFIGKSGHERASFFKYEKKI